MEGLVKRRFQLLEALKNVLPIKSFVHAWLP